MATMTEVKAGLAGDTRVKRERNKLAKMFAAVPPDRRVLVGRMIENAAFLAVFLEDLRADIDKNGYIEIYQHGANQSGTKRSVAADLYMVSVKNYSQVVKQLQDMLPNFDDQDDELMKFLKEHR